MITYGFFNSVNNDRVYDADAFNTFFEGLISSNGIFNNVGGAFAVTASTGLTVSVGTGKALVNSRWVKSDAVENVTLATPNALLDRYDMISLRRNSADRSIKLHVTTGTPAQTPIKPTPVKNADIGYEIVLAYIRVPANAISITSSNITDTRYDTNLCGLIHVLVEQIDTTTLYNQYRDTFDRLQDDMESWGVEQRQAYEEWFNTLTGSLQVNTYIERVQADYTVTDEKWYIQIPNELNYSTTDILDVYVNGVLARFGAEYSIQENEVEGGYMVKFVESLQGNADTTQIITFIVTRSKIGANV